MTIPHDRQDQELPVTERERTALRGLLGALQWPSTQTAPHLQAHVSLLAGEISTATTKTLEEANKTLRYAKANSDVGLDYRYLGAKEDMAFVAFSDASFACRKDLSSQGGYIIMMKIFSFYPGSQFATRVPSFNCAARHSTATAHSIQIQHQLPCVVARGQVELLCSVGGLGPFFKTLQDATKPFLERAWKR